MAKDLVLVKIGGSVITDKGKPFTPRIDVIERIAREIHEARREKDFDLVVGHGGGSYPHTSAAAYLTHVGVVNDQSYQGISRVHNDAAKLNRLFVDTLIRNGENAISVQPSAVCVSNDGKIKEWFMKPLEMKLKLGLLPVPYGDVSLDEKRGCTILSTEVILDHLAKKLGAKRVILGCAVDGVLVEDPADSSKTTVINEITNENYDSIKKYLSGSNGIDVTGGMIHKVEKMLELSKSGIRTELINVNKPGYLKRALLGEKNLGTVIR